VAVVGVKTWFIMLPFRRREKPGVGKFGKVRGVDGRGNTRRTTEITRGWRGGSTSKQETSRLGGAGELGKIRGAATGEEGKSEDGGVA
jgi:hypothetical protein